MKKSIVSLFIFIVIFNYIGLSQNPTYIDKYEPLKKPNYLWLSSGDLQIEFELNTISQKTEKNTAVGNFNAVGKWNNENDEETKLSKDFSKQKNSFNYVVIISKEDLFGNTSDTTVTLYEDERWEYIKYDVSYNFNIDSISRKCISNEYIIFSKKEAIPYEDEIENFSLDVTSFKMPYTKEYGEIKIKANTDGYDMPSSFYISNISVTETKQQNGVDYESPVAVYTKWDGDILKDDRNLKARVKFIDKANVVPNKKYNIQIEYYIYGFKRKCVDASTLTAEIEFRIIETIDAQNKKIDDIYFTGKDDDFTFTLKTTALDTANFDFSSSKLFIKYEPIDTHNYNKKFGPTDDYNLALNNNGNAVIDIKLKGCPDNVYKITIGGTIESYDGKTNNLSEKNIYIFKNTKNHLRTVQFTYNKKAAKTSVQLAFTLKNNVPVAQLSGLTKGDAHKSQIKKDPTNSNIYIFEKEILDSKIKKEKYITLQVEDGNGILFEYNFVAIAQKELQDEIHNAILEVLEKPTMQKVKPKKITKNIDAIRAKVYPNVSKKFDFAAKSNLVTSENMTQFKKELEREIDNYLFVLSKAKKKQFKTDDFVNTEFNKVAQSISALSLKYLNVIVIDLNN